jgi:mRNA interferase RelE/StbE
LAWTIRFDRRFERDLQRLDKIVQRRIIAYLEDRVALLDIPTALGHPLSSELAGHWRYRIGDYRVICRFERDHLIIVAVAVGHRSTIYD